MIKEYIKKPIVISALEYTGTNEDEIIKFCGNRGVDYDNINGLFIYTLEGRMKVDIGDYVIRGIAGEYYPCKPNIFYLTYDEVGKYTPYGTIPPAVSRGDINEVIDLIDIGNDNSCDIYEAFTGECYMSPEEKFALEFTESLSTNYK